MRKSQRAFLHFLSFYLLCSQSESSLMADESKRSLISSDEEDLQQLGGQDFLLLCSSSSNTPPAKTEWPEVVGLAPEEATKKIKEAMPEAVVRIVPPDHSVTMDFNTGRVRLYTDSAGLVAKPARIG